MTSIGARAVIAASGFARSLGKTLDNMGKAMEVAKYTERLVPSTRFVAVDGVAPTLSQPDGAMPFVAPSASVVGNVTLGVNASVWYGATVRGDVNSVSIGDNSSIGENAVVHVAKIQGDHPTLIGQNVMVGPRAVIHACTLQDGVTVGATAQVLDGAVVGANSELLPGTVVTPGTSVPAGQVWSGSPAKFVRDRTTDEIDSSASFMEAQVEMAKLHAIENAKDYFEVAHDADLLEDSLQRDPDYYDRLDPDEVIDDNDVLGQGSPGRIFNSTLSHPEEGLELILAQRKQREEQKKAEEEARNRPLL